MAYQHKLAEKLTILNERGRGVLIRINYIKKVRQPSLGLIRLYRTTLHTGLVQSRGHKQGSAFSAFYTALRPIGVGRDQSGV